MDLSRSATLTNAQAIDIAKALHGNTVLQELHLVSVRLTNMVAKGVVVVVRCALRSYCVGAALADMLTVNHTLRVLNLEDNKLDSDGIEALARALQSNRGLLELTLFQNRCVAAFFGGSRSLVHLQRTGRGGAVDLDPLV